MAGRWGEVAAGLVLAIVAATFLGWGIDRYPLWDVDEARHSEIAREMHDGVGASRFFLPTYAHQPYRERPPTYYWLVCASFAALGVSALAARLVTVVAATIVVLAVYAYAARRDGPAAGLGAALVACTCAGFAALARYATLDMTMTACTTAGVLSGLAWMDEPPPRRRLLGPYVGAGLATLVKGPIGVVLVALPLLAMAAARRVRVSWREVAVGRGAIVLAAIVGSVAIAIACFDPTFLLDLASSNARGFAVAAPRAAPIYSQLLWFPLLVVPWTVLAAPILWHSWRDRRTLALLLWLVSVLLLFSLPRGKLPTDILPAIPPFALLVGPELVAAMDDDADEDDRWLRIGAWTHVGLLGVLAVAATGLGAAGASRGAALVLVLACSWWALVTVVALRRELPGAVPPIVAASVLTGVPLVLNLMTPFASNLVSEERVGALARQTHVETVIAFRKQSPSLLFYSPVPVVYVDRRKTLREMFEGERPVLLTTSRRNVALVESTLGALAHRWDDTGRRRVYGNRPLPAE